MRYRKYIIFVLAVVLCVTLCSCGFSNIGEQGVNLDNDPVDSLEVSPPAVEPDDPVTPGNHDEPDHPAEPDEPSEPDHPAEPDEPSEPDHPAEPDEPSEPDHPAEPDEPSEPVPPQYVITYSGKYVYGAVTGMSSDSPDNPFTFKSVNELSLIREVNTKSIQESDMEGEHMLNVFGNDVLLRYQLSRFTPENADPVIKKYNDIYVFNGENDIYHISPVTNQLMHYYYFPDRPTGDLSAEKMMEIAVDILTTQLNRSVDSYVVREEIRTNSRYRTFRFDKKICGFNTSDTIRIMISTSGAIKAVFVGHTGEFDRFDDTFTQEDIYESIEELSSALYQSGYYMQAGGTKYSLVTDGHGRLFVLAEYASGYTFYVEVNKDNA